MSTGNAENPNSVTHLPPCVAFISSQPPLDPVLGFNYTEYHHTASAFILISGTYFTPIPINFVLDEFSIKLLFAYASTASVL
jgi:hypothetical protein